MNIDELNKVLKVQKPDGINVAYLRGPYHTFFTREGHDVIVLTERNYWQFLSNDIVSQKFFDIVRKYANTPLEQRLSQRKYVVPIVAKDDEYICYRKSSESFDENNSAECFFTSKVNLYKHVPETFKFNDGELKSLYKSLNDMHGNHFVTVAKAATVKLDDFKNNFLIK